MRTAILLARWALTVRNHTDDVRILAVISKQLQPQLVEQLAPLKMSVACAERALDIGRLIGQGVAFQVAILPAATSHAEWWALWGELCQIEPRPEILVYARATSFQLWTGVLDMGGFDVIVEPFSDLEIQGAILRAVQCFEERTAERDSND
jgi:hypothetical protein